MEKSYQHAKILFIGDSRTGKTRLLQMESSDASASHHRYQQTIKFAFYPNRHFYFPKGDAGDLELVPWELGGSMNPLERHSLTSRGEFTSADAYAITFCSTYLHRNLVQWLDLIKMRRSEANNTRECLLVFIETYWEAPHEEDKLAHRMANEIEIYKALKHGDFLYFQLVIGNAVSDASEIKSMWETVARQLVVMLKARSQEGKR